MSSPATGSANGSAIDRVRQEEASGSTRSRSHPDPIQQINAGGIGRVPDIVDFKYHPDGSSFWYERAYLPGQPKSLSGIATRAFCLGLILSTSIICTFYILLITNSSLWRLPFFFAAIALFHFLEFWTTARYNTRAAQIGSFLISQNGSAYQIAHAAASLECFISKVFFSNRLWAPSSLARAFLSLGMFLVVIGQVVRSLGMIQAGSNFNHMVQYQKAREHNLVTTGIYGYFRHPSYFGFFWWALGTQLVLGNVICLIGYAAVLWKFFSRRISGEEEFLVAFFGEDYVKYRQRTHVWIPFLR